MQRSERELIEAARGGEGDAVDELLAQHEQKLFRFGLRMCGNEEEAREVLETMLAAFRGMAGFRGEARLSTWLYQIARGYCLKSRRRSSGEPAQMDGLDAASGVAAEAEPADLRTHAREIGEALHAAILALPESLREAVVLRDVEELDGEEAAKVLGIELAALKSRLHRGRAELRKHLSVLLDPAGPIATPCADLAREMREFSTADIDRAPVRASSATSSDAHGVPQAACSSVGPPRSAAACRARSCRRPCVPRCGRRCSPPCGPGPIESFPCAGPRAMIPWFVVRGSWFRPSASASSRCSRSESSPPVLATFSIHTAGLCHGALR